MFIFFFKQKTAYEMRISDWSSDVCSSDLAALAALARRGETGEGERVDVAMLDVSVAALANQEMNYLVSGATPTRKGNKHPRSEEQRVGKEGGSTCRYRWSP